MKYKKTVTLLHPGVVRNVSALGTVVDLETAEEV